MPSPIAKRAKCAALQPDFFSTLSFEKTSHITSFLEQKDFFSLLKVSKNFSEEKDLLPMRIAQGIYNSRHKKTTQAALAILFGEEAIDTWQKIFSLNLLHMTSLNLANKQITDDQLEALLATLTEICPLRVTTLNLSNNQISAVGCFSLAFFHALGKLPSLQALTVSNNPRIQTEGFFKLAGTNLAPSKLGAQLTYLDVQDCNINLRAAIRMVQQNPHLRYIS